MVVAFYRVGDSVSLCDAAFRLTWCVFVSVWFDVVCCYCLYCSMRVLCVVVMGRVLIKNVLRLYVRVCASESFCGLFVLFLRSVCVVLFSVFIVSCLVVWRAVVLCCVVVCAWCVLVGCFVVLVCCVVLRVVVVCGVVCVVFGCCVCVIAVWPCVMRCVGVLLLLCCCCCCCVVSVCFDLIRLVLELYLALD